jgi:hypothetical protein
MVPWANSFALRANRASPARDLPLIVADGMHRLSAAWHHDESADVTCVLVDRPKG